MIIFPKRSWGILSGSTICASKGGVDCKKKPVKTAPKSHLNRYGASFRKSIGTTGVPYLEESDFKMLDADAEDWDTIYQCPRKQVGGIPTQVLKGWEEFVSESSLDIAKRLFAWTSRVAVAAGLIWREVLSKAPGTTVLIKMTS